MIAINEIHLDLKPRTDFMSNYPPPPNLPTDEPDMTEFDSAFLCGLLNKFQPKKILEIGVGGGATTGVILNCLENIGQKYEMISLDISEKYYLDKKRPTGFLADSVKKNLGVGAHKFYLGTVFPFVANEIGDDIDFLILDTTHVMPGENLDFLVTLPYLKKDAVVCLHDVSWNHIKDRISYGHATTALFSAVCADKILNFIKSIDENGRIELKYPNIAAFQINENTVINIENVFLTLIMRWHHWLSDEQLNGYMAMLKKYYPSELFVIFLEALRLNAQTLFADFQVNVEQK